MSLNILITAYRIWISCQSFAHRFYSYYSIRFNCNAKDSSIQKVKQEKETGRHNCDYTFFVFEKKKRIILYFGKRVGSWILAMQVFIILLLLIKIYDYCFHISHVVNIKNIIFHADCRQWPWQDMDGCGYGYECGNRYRYGYGYGQDCRFVCLLLKFVDGIRAKKEEGRATGAGESHSIAWSAVITQAEAPFGLEPETGHKSIGILPPSPPLSPFPAMWHCCNSDSDSDSAQLSGQ